MLQPDQSCERYSNCQARACGKRYLTGFDQKSQGEWRPMYMYIFQSDSSHCILWWRRICIFPRLMFITHKWNVLGNGDITEESRRTLCTNRVYPLGRKNKQVNQLKEYFWEWWLLWRKNHAPVVKSDWGENTGWISRGVWKASLKTGTEAWPMRKTQLWEEQQAGGTATAKALKQEETLPKNIAWGSKS